MTSGIRVVYENAIRVHSNAFQSTLRCTYLSEKGSCKIFIASMPQCVTHCNCGYLMWTTTPHILYRQRGWASLLHIEARLISELFPDFQSSILRQFTQYQFHATAASQVHVHSMDHKSTLVLVLGCPLLICTKFKVYSRQVYPKSADKTAHHERSTCDKKFSLG